MRLIDANALRQEIESKIYWGQISKDNVESLDEIDDAPTVDAVPVVRRKDCKHYESPEKGIFETCTRNGNLIPMLPDDFCSWGESMDGGNEDE